MSIWPFLDSVSQVLGTHFWQTFLLGIPLFWLATRQKNGPARYQLTLITYLTLISLPLLSFISLPGHRAVHDGLINSFFSPPEELFTSPITTVEEQAVPATEPVPAITYQTQTPELGLVTPPSPADPVRTAHPVTQPEPLTGQAGEAQSSALFRLPYKAILLGLAVLWFAVAVMKLLLLCRDAVLMGRLLKQARPITDPDLVTWFRFQCESMDVSPRIRLLVSKEIGSPMAAGFFTPAVLLPHHLLQHLSEVDLKHGILHELAHLKRGDIWINLIQKTAHCFYFYHPLLRALEKRLSWDREIACDALAATWCRKPVEYAESLVRVYEHSRLQRTPALVAGMFGGRSQLSVRIESMLSGSGGAVRRGFGLSGGLCLAFLVIAALGTAYLAPPPTTNLAVAEDDETLIAVSGGSELTTAGVGSNADLTFNNGTQSFALGSTGAVAAAGAGSGASAGAWSGSAAGAGAGAGSGVGSGTGVTMTTTTSSSTSNTFIMSDGDDTNIVIDSKSSHEYEGNRNRLSLQMKGRIELTSDERGFAAMGRNAVFKYESSGREDIYLKVTSNGKDLNFRFKRDGESQDESQAKAYLAESLPRILAEMGVNSRARVKRYLAEMGTSGVLSFIDTLISEHAKAQHYKALLETKDLKKAETQQVLKALVSIDSDYEKSQVLQIAARNNQDPETWATLLDVVATLDSDYERGQILRAMPADMEPSVETYNLVLSLLAEIGSDYERSQALKRLITQYRDPNLLTPTFWQMVEKTGSDYERAGVLTTVLQSIDMDDSHQARFIENIEDMGSDYERANLCLDYLNRYQPTGANRTQFLAVVDSIGSSYERRRVKDRLNTL